ncbi:spore germination lipoprotein GerD [Radiobacillus deserti]|uniref:Spore gernimation protein GerD n=1 Tax=Radiobacillus deserti TaxID=2594883 RepID=A0A516KBY2_9BACI|nr:spore germination lipoprotein GerD [Radiobacillus deserti]QDP38923.1 spore gernimation protein GerD [Radiobacillus deserti]
MNKQLCRMILFISFLILTACGAGGGAANGEQADYDTTKKMVTDILKTDEGKKAITEVLTDGEMQQKYVIESDVVKQSITDALTSDKGKEFWSKMFSDPKFVEEFGKTLQDQQKDIMKSLMADSEYQKKMMDILKNPEMEEQMMNVLTSQKFRENLEKVIQETIETPAFKAKVSEIVLKAAEEMKKPEEKSGGGQKKEQGQGQ